MPYVITARHAEGSAPPADIIAAGADPARVYCAACIDAYRNGIEPGEPACDEAITVAVATLEGARAAGLAALELGQPNRPNHAGAHATVCAIQELPEAGGTIGPLPDGTIIDVAPMSWADMTDVLVQSMDDAPIEADEIIAAYNARP